MRCVRGRLYFIGGHDSTKGAAGGKTCVCGEYDPATDRWTLKAPMPTAREDMGSAVIGREIWVFGGLDNRGHEITSDVEVYDTATDTWTTRAQWINPRCLGDFACTDGRAIYLICGTSTMGEYPSLCPSLTPQVYLDGIFYDLPPMPQGHCYTEVEMLNGCIYVLGGASVSTTSYTERIDRFDTRGRTWLDPLEMPYLANGIGAAQYRGKLYVTGGWHEGEFVPYFYVMDQPPSPLAETRYGGGHGTADDPYRIWTAEQMNAVGAHPQDWDRYFKLMADVDLSGFDGREERSVFNRIAPDTDPEQVHIDFQGPPFTGVFDGNGHTISHLTITGEGYVGLFGLLAHRAEVRDLGLVDVNVTGCGDRVGGLIGCSQGTVSYCYSSGVVHGSGDYTGGLIGSNEAEVSHCYSTGEVNSTGSAVGGLAGASSGDVTQCYTDCAVTGRWSIGGLIGQNWGKILPSSAPRWVVRAGTVADSHSISAVRGIGIVGGLVGDNARGGTVNRCYSAGPVDGGDAVGGLVGRGGDRVARSFWNTQTSGQATSPGGTGLTTYEMQCLSTFLGAGWDFVCEMQNGTDDTWWMLNGWDYPRLTYKAFSPEPYDGAMDVLALPALRWTAGRGGEEHDIYFGDNELMVLNATYEDPDVYRGRQPAAAAVYDPGALQGGKTYYWRIDGVNVADLNSPWKGRVWKFSTADFVAVATVDDFEGYTDDTNAGTAVFQTWTDGLSLDPNTPANGTGSLVGNSLEPFAEQTIVHSGRQSMPIGYNNLRPPWYSQAERTWQTPQDWTGEGADTLTLYFRGDVENDRDRLYVGIEDSPGRIAWITHRDAYAMLITEWQKWHIPLADIRAAGVDPSAVRRLHIGVGDRDHPQPGGRGTIYIDDIRLTRHTR